MNEPLASTIWALVFVFVLLGGIHVNVLLAERIASGTLVAYTEARPRNQNLRFSGRPMKQYTRLAVAVLVNQGTAEGAEIVAAALQESGRASLVGTRTFGKPSIQTIIPVGDGSALRLTTREMVHS